MFKTFVALLTTVALATGCSGGGDQNDADEAFAQAMVPHHEQAVEMAEMVAGKTDVSPELTDLADRIAAAQQPEIDRMSGWLEEWGTDDHGSMDHSGEGHASMDGMMSDSAMSDLAALDGTAFEQAWLQMMIEHHRGAVTAAETVIDDGSDPDVRELAEQVVATQDDEITEMEGLLS